MEAGHVVGGIHQDCAGIEQPENGSKFPNMAQKCGTTHHHVGSSLTGV